MFLSYLPTTDHQIKKSLFHVSLATAQSVATQKPNHHTQTKSSKGILQYYTKEDIVAAGQPVIISSSELTLLLRKQMKLVDISVTRRILHQHNLFVKRYYIGIIVAIEYDVAIE